MSNDASLPSPDADEVAHSQRLTATIRQAIAQSGGAIPFSRYMDMALYAPGLGYYMAGAHKFGGGGDFVTAPELTPLFGACVGNACSPVLQHCSAPTILELGAGSGRLALDVLHHLDGAGQLPQSYWILEPSPELRQRQKSLLEADPVSRRVNLVWLETWPEAFDGVILANEVMDALPVERFRIGSDAVEQAYVGYAQNDFHVEWQPAQSQLAEAVEAIIKQSDQGLPAGYISELCLMLPAWVDGLSRCLRNGVVLLMDYGYSRREYYHPQRNQGSLRCHYKHRAHNNPFWLPGIQDITAWVDFTAAAQAASAQHLQVAAYATQAEFLIAAGMTDALQQLSGIEQLQATNAAKRLLMPGEMGEAFKLMALSRNINWPLARALATSRQRL